MSGKNKASNFDIAKAEADKVDEKIIEALRSKRSFLVEAGAGSGKTYSLNKAIGWLQANKWTEFRQKSQTAVCITYTNAAVDVIAERLSSDTFIVPATIHSFAWNSIKQYQQVLIDIISNNREFWPVGGGLDEISEVSYTLGYRYIEDGILYLFHADVLKLFCWLLDNPKFRRFFSDKYPLILIDEYQDSFKPITDRFIKYFISKNTGPQFGFFGDAWQTIYQSSNACGFIESSNLEVIKKGSNFRSSPRIVQFLNMLRPDLPQKSAIDGFSGEVVAVISNNCTDSNSQKSSPGFNEKFALHSRLNNIIEKIKEKTSSDESLKVMMITHKVLASQQGYDQLFSVLGSRLKDKEDQFLLFFMNVVEPIYTALSEANAQLLFDALGVSRVPITNKGDKIRWHMLQQQLKVARNNRALDVFEVIKDSKLVPIPPKLIDWYQLYQQAPETPYASECTIRTFLGLDYSQFLSAISFLQPDAIFSTEHGVKGEEYDNVVFVISGGWNQYKFETYAPMITGHSAIPDGKQASFERNRNLFYVCCSRPKKRLILFITVPVNQVFNSFLEDLVGKTNIYTYEQYLAL